ncbi:pleckstrin homology domain-containing family A member 8-like [Salvelinus namaycush]|uniref:Pleckstrin homology domain-containing family A member 8 n=1 Tax=Salvelinus namaycush TaxID=8040 RepID=A0A8U0QBD9_SALNM|nr:pleckstrin homology domain-containing family A member 8-like [Salvelinus namaycush]XP_038839903.1 pleckstrin homology domain-containing family A member 8-like [Salvelinus namaycush]XP_038841428.1 pleckstrin homology domain-containing family A member 8-like [Salvelinus namaycush]XP_038841429.1 pleckstrin homology domain-containing family A member 8-like [Salvelinus namaycush]
MEGILYKWTNYISGWQPRWFVLEGGTLSYYDSQEDSWKGCKGSIKISVCEIQVHSSDFTRVDLTIPGEQYFYLRAINAAERQKWLVALGSAKACLTDNRTKREKEHQENTEALKTKMSELRLYCDLLLQQVNQIKDSEENEEAGENPGTMVKSTCTTFIKTLEECMLIANRTFSSDQATKTPPGSPPVATIKPQKVKPVNQSNQEKHRECKEISGGSVTHDNQSLDCGAEGPDQRDGPDTLPERTTQTPPTEHSPAGGDHQGPEESAVEEEATTQTTHTNPDPEHTDQPAQQEEEEEFKEVEQEMRNAQEEEKQEVTQNQQEAVTDQAEAKLEEEQPSQPQEEEREEEETEQVDTFFSTMSHRFSDIRLDGDSGIPTQAFLDSCYAIVPVLDKLGSTVFGPVKMDFTGNIKKIHQKLSSDPGSFPTLQTIVLHEVQTGVARVRNSATEALLWLKRGLKFLKEFLSLVNSGERDIPGALGNAYGRSLRQYHGWVVRGVFALALRAAPSYSSFAAALVSREGDELKEGFNTGMHRDLGVYLPAMENQLAILDALYEEYNLESDEVV